MLDIEVLGTLRILRDGRPLEGFASSKVRCLVAYLAIESDRWHHRGDLAARFWPDQDPQRGLVYVRNALSNIRKTLGSPSPLLEDDTGHVRFDAAADYHLDLDQLEAALDACERHPHRRASTCPTCIERIESALALCRGPVLGGLADGMGPALQAWLAMIQERAHQLTVELETRLARDYIALGAWQDAQRLARRLVERDTWREESHQILMRVLAATGQRSAALRQFQACRSILAEELQVEPASDTLEQYRRILQSTSARPTKAARPLGLPLANGPMLGREAELSRLVTHLGDPRQRLISVIGPYGVGKSRLALEAADRAAPQFHDRVWWLPSDGFDDLAQWPELLARAASVIGAGEADSAADLADHIGQQSGLLVLDGCVQRCELCIRLVHRLLRSCPELCILITSRQAFAIEGETQLRLHPLARVEESGGDDALRFFQHWARQANPGFALDARNQQAASALCDRLDNLPLGILLAACRVDSHSVEQIDARVAQDLGWLDAPLAPQNPQTLSISGRLDRSFTTLSPSAQQVLRQLSMLPGEWSPEAYAAVFDSSSISADRIPEHVSQFVSRSLVRSRRTKEGRRYRMYETVRSFASQRLNA